MPEYFKIRVISPWPVELKAEDTWFSSDHDSQTADALLCNWSPSEELFTFPRRKGWYCCEPQCQFNQMDGGSWPKIQARLASHEFLWHNHPEDRFRVPHITHFEKLQVFSNDDRLDRAISVVSNFGGRPWRRHRDLAYRNRFVTHQSVDLYRAKRLENVSSALVSRPDAPFNYKGEVAGDWPESKKRDLMARYKIALCLENSCEPHYFTEKFVEAVCAGCTPVYRAHETVKHSLLHGAVWIDPADFHHDPGMTIEAAGNLSRERLKANANWLQSNPELRQTSHESVFLKIAEILSK